MDLLRPKRAKVFITGAGPGDPGLLTIKAKKILEIADVVIYDNLVSDEILELALYLNPTVKLIYAGRVGYEPEKSVNQDKVNQLLLELVSDYKIICRLKGGDPSVFGHFGEEIIFLKENKVDFEVVSGVSSVTAVPSYAGIPLTHRDHASSFTVLAAQGDPEDLENNIRWENFDAVNGTLVVLMGVKKLPRIIKKLLSLGRNKATPLAVIYAGTTSKQETFITTIGGAENDLKNIEIKPPSLIVIGEVVDYSTILNWHESKALFGKKVLVTRSMDQSYSFASKLRELGAEPILFPLVSYEINEKEIYNKNIINNLKKYNWIFFTSQNAVRFFFEILKKNCFDSRALSGVKVAAVGYKTKCELAKYNIIPDFVPKRFSLRELINELLEIEDISDKSILYPTQVGTEHIKPLSRVTNWTIYKANFRDNIDVKLLEKLQERIDAVTLFSPNTSRHLSNLVKKYNLTFSNAFYAVIGEETASVAKELFGNVDVIANPSTEDGLLAGIEDFFVQRREKVLSKN